jgi:hypothetical protein
MLLIEVAMANAAGESSDEFLKLDFNRHFMFSFADRWITGDEYDKKTRELKERQTLRRPPGAANACQGVVTSTAGLVTDL